MKAFRRKRDPEGRMALADHLREFRNRLLIAAGAIVLGCIPGWLLYDQLIRRLSEPLLARGGDINFGGLTDPFAVQLQMALFVGLLLASPMWLYQSWAFIVPGLTRREKRTAIAFILTAVPLFLSGCYLAYLTLPKAVDILLTFTPEGGRNIIAASDYLGFLTRFVLAFGFAFLLPVFLVGLNLAHVLSARAMLRGWRFAVIGLFLFAAVMTPTPDPWTMLALAVPLIALYFAAFAVAWLVDRRRDRTRPAWVEVADDTASTLGSDQDPGPLGPDRARPLR
ncbi:MAG TPA: twin-arginine translocase subunit TatC [Dermatophilaceae bacterium]|nr:twin-arginine translocase subunit TatC [Dermatophilaceae bacterium]